jgi:hypothetical protein
VRNPRPAEVVLQTRCVFCKREQYALNSLAVSHGNAGCSWCGRVPPIFYDIERYRAALRANGNP